MNNKLNLQLNLPLDCATDAAQKQPSASARVFTNGAATANYWSSTENNANNAWYQSFSDGSQSNNNKNNLNRVRCVRSQYQAVPPIGAIEKLQEDIVPIADYPFTLEEVFKAYYSCRKNKRNSDHQIQFEMDLEKNLINLFEEIKSQRYKPLPSEVFVVTKPKPREVWAAQFRDRVVHHIIYNRISPWYHKRFIQDSYACIPGRGIHNAVTRAVKATRKETKNYKDIAYFGKFDLANFFASIHLPTVWKIFKRDGVLENDVLQFLLHETLFNQRREEAIKKGNALNFSKVPEHKSLFKAHQDRGLPIGNLDSQLIANVVMNELDWYMKHVVGVEHYIRYVDDILIIHQDIRFIKRCHLLMENFVSKRLLMNFNPKKTIFNQTSKGIDLLGYFILPGRVYLRRNTYRRVERNLANSKLNLNKENFDKSLAAYRGMFSHCQSKFNL
ncbi:reverse transcriptase domain-containing protein [Thiomicrorhabdus indica]|uniref:reverse transcriptase domain-containing protein n=1 Tax=Thiomicrorhabdus indica TaxID=2267253 RepID=UPI00102DCEEF|nr:reverse transcriptase domain-containing protein [Thiomicrorhabdus indica]